MLLAAGPALATDFEHRGSLALLVSAGGEYRSAISALSVTENGPRVNFDLGTSLAFSSRWSALLEGRVSLGGFTPGVSFFGGLRNRWGEQLKTFFDLTVGVHALPSFSIGPRVAFGLQYELSPIMGVYALIGAQFGGGTALRFVGEAMIGVQFRSYLFE